ncbi:MAG: acyl carrier protein [Paludibacteraceae bacterium]|nr:acyl carrier protein [Paludibacteraceae bacterium]MBQ2521054.1 acyl carrier protein [Paludibacteraceae bacterium]MBQ4018569.1 acyl carrier protein [Paludibacteraceae bacterium]MBQ5379551.1 acyl carrier protein [Paludibacteraceae bacterium]
MNKQEIIEKVNNLLEQEFEIESSLLTPEASLKSDLEIDSLDFVDIVVLIDREFGFKPKAEELKNVKTLEDFYEYIGQHV